MHPNTMTLDGTTYHIGGIIYYVNQYGQRMAGRIVGIWTDALLVKRKGWYATETVNPRDYVRTRYFKPAWA